MENTEATRRENGNQDTIMSKPTVWVEGIGVTIDYWNPQTQGPLRGSRAGAAVGPPDWGNCNLKEVDAMGWDGDDVAGKMEEVFEQQQAAADARANRGTSSVEERARSAKFESLRLSRSRIMTQLAAATNPAHRAMLESALKSINDQMAE
jgi:hypothetical protein